MARRQSFKNIWRHAGVVLNSGKSPRGWTSVRKEAESSRKRDRRNVHISDQTASRQGASEGLQRSIKTEADLIRVLARRYVLEELVRRDAEGSSRQTSVLETGYGQALEMWWEVGMRQSRGSSIGEDRVEHECMVRRLQESVSGEVENFSVTRQLGIHCCVCCGL